MTSYAVTDPATGELLEEFPTATDAEVERALARAEAAYGTWRETALSERCAVAARAAAGFRERAGELAATANREMGKSVRAARGELDLVAEIFDFYADRAPGLLADHEYKPASGGRAVVQKRPVGVLLGIMPWNYPYYQVARFAAPNLVLGNVVLLKHAPSCPRSALAIADVLAGAGVPEGVFTNLFLSNEQVATVIADGRLRGVSLTGSERAGSAVGELAGRHLKKAVLELGGSDPLLVLGTDDVAATARAAFSSRMANTGQACNSPKRMIVREEYAAEFVAELVDAARAAATSGRLAPLASRAAAETVRRQVRDAAAAGATLHVGGELSEVGAFLTPAVLTGVTREMDLFHEEVFGPAIVVHTVRDADEAVALANDSVYGLGASVFATDEELAWSVAQRLDCGMVYLNTTEESEADLPFGGVKRSGFGRELGALGIDEFANHKLIRLP